jgi:hypothetical protein
MTVVLHLSVPLLTDSLAVRVLGLLSAACNASSILYTLVFIMPTNRTLMAMDKQSEDGTEAEEMEKAVTLFQKWDQVHAWRMVIYFSGWAAGLAALLTAVATTSF